MTASGRALLIIDMISAFDFPEATTMRKDLLRVARQIRRLREHFQARGLPIIYANDNFANWRADFRELSAFAAASGEIGAEVTSLLKPAPEHYFVLKPKHSAFLATALPILLAKLGVETLYLTGMTADSCILATALDANAREYRVFVLRDAVAGIPARKRHALSTISSSRAGEVISSRSAMARIK